MGRRSELEDRPTAEEITLAIAGVIVGDTRDGGLYHAAVVKRVRPIIEAALKREREAALISQSEPAPAETA